MRYYFTVQWGDIDSVGYFSIENMESFILNCLKINRHPHFQVNANNLILNKSFWNLLKLFYENKVNYSIYAANLNLNSEISQKLKDMGCLEVQMSLDGLRKTHDELHMNGSYDKTLKNLSNLRQAGIKTDVLTLVSRRNINQIPWIVDEVVRNKADTYHFSSYCQSKDVDIPDYKKLLEGLWDKYKEYKYFNTSFSIKENILSLLNYERYLFDENELCRDCNLKRVSNEDITLSDNVEKNLDEKLVKVF